MIRYCITDVLNNKVTLQGWLCTKLTIRICIVSTCIIHTPAWFRKRQHHEVKVWCSADCMHNGIRSQSQCADSHERVRKQMMFLIIFICHSLDKFEYSRIFNRWTIQYDHSIHLVKTVWPCPKIFSHRVTMSFLPRAPPQPSQDFRKSPGRS